jgi:uncharacterized protein YggE
MDRFKYLSLGAVTVLALVLVVGLAAIAGAVATAAIIDDVDEANQEVEASKVDAAAEAAVKKALAVAAAKTPATTQVSPAASQSGTSQSGIWVAGEGSVTLEPDLALLSLGVEARGETVSEALADASTAMDAVLGALRGRGIQDRDIQTRNFRVRARYDYQEVVQSGVRREERVLSEYVVTNTVTAKIRDLASVGDVIDDVATAGGDATRIDDVGFTVDDQSVYAEELRSKAVADAMEKARHFASLAGVSLGEPSFISEAAASSPGVPVFRESAAFAMAAAAPATSISGGELELRMSVQVLFEIE